MKKNLHPIDEIFLDALAENQEQPLVGTWDAIENSLDKNIANTFKLKYARLQKLLVLLLILLVGVSIYTINSSKKTNTANTVINTPAVANEPLLSKDAKVTPRSSVQNTTKNKIVTAPLVKTSEIKKVDVTAAKTRSEKSASIVVAKTPKVFHPLAKTNKPTAEATLKIEKQSIPKENPIVDKTIYTSNKKQNSKNPIKETTTPVAIESNEKTEKPTTKIKVATIEPKDVNETSHVQMEQIESTKTNRNLNSGIPENNQIQLIANVIPNVTVENTTIAIVEQKTKIKTPISFSITPNLSLNTLNTRIVTGEDLGSRREYLRKQITESETAKIGTSFGLAVEINLSKRISIESGINYSEKNTTIKPRTISAERDREGKIKYRFDCSAGTYYIDPKLGTTVSLGDSTKSYSAKNKLQYISTPFIAKYHLVTGKINWFPMVGVGTNVLVGQNFETDIDNISEKLNNLKTSDLRKLYFNAIIGTGIDFKISKRLSLTVAPSYRFSLNSMNKNEAIKTYQNNFNTMAGLKIGL